MYFKGLKFLTFSTLILCSVAIASGQTSGSNSGASVTGTKTQNSGNKSDSKKIPEVEPIEPNIKSLYDKLSPDAEDATWSANVIGKLVSVSEEFLTKDQMFTKRKNELVNLVTERKYDYLEWQLEKYMWEDINKVRDKKYTELGYELPDDVKTGKLGGTVKYIEGKYKKNVQRHEDKRRIEWIYLGKNWTNVIKECKLRDIVSDKLCKIVQKKISERDGKPNLEKGDLDEERNYIINMISAIYLEMAASTLDILLNGDTGNAVNDDNAKTAGGEDGSVNVASSESDLTTLINNLGHKPLKNRIDTLSAEKPDRLSGFVQHRVRAPNPFGIYLQELKTLKNNVGYAYNTNNISTKGLPTAAKMCEIITDALNDQKRKLVIDKFPEKDDNGLFYSVIMRRMPDVERTLKIDDTEPDVIKMLTSSELTPLRNALGYLREYTKSGTAEQEIQKRHEISTIIQLLRSLGNFKEKEYIEFVSLLTKRYASAAGVIESIKQDLQDVRKGELEDQVAKFVGRVNMGGYTGTGTIITWDGIPEELKGRVVLTCAHNRIPPESLDDCWRDALKKDKRDLKKPTTIRSILLQPGGDYTDYLSPPHPDWEDFETACEKSFKAWEYVTATDLEGQTNVNMLDNHEKLSFMLDLSDDESDVETYAVHISHGTNEKHTVIPVAATYVIADPIFAANLYAEDQIDENDAEGKGPDIQILILKEPARDYRHADTEGKYPVLAGYNLDRSLNIQQIRKESITTENGSAGGQSTIDLTQLKEKYVAIGYPLFPIGYGTVLGITYKENIAGWNTKKKGHFKNDNGIGQSDSGGPVVYEKTVDGKKDFIIVGVTSEANGQFVPLLKYIPWIKGVAKDYYNLTDHSKNPPEEPRTETNTSEVTEVEITPDNTSEPKTIGVPASSPTTTVTPATAAPTEPDSSSAPASIPTTDGENTGSETAPGTDPQATHNPAEPGDFNPVVPPAPTVLANTDEYDGDKSPAGPAAVQANTVDENLQEAEPASTTPDSSPGA